MKFRAICENHLYAKAYSKGKRAVTRSVAVYMLPDYTAERLRRAHPQKIKVNRIGLTVTKKLGGAVIRNRVRRRLREVYRLSEARFMPGWDMVVVARSRCIKADFAALTNAYLSLAEKAGVLKEDAQ